MFQYTCSIDRVTVVPDSLSYQRALLNVIILSLRFYARGMFISYCAVSENLDVFLFCFVKIGLAFILLNKQIVMFYTEKGFEVYWM